MKYPHALSLGLALAALLQAGVLAAAGSADWLARMAQALRTQNYEGVLVYAQGGRMESMRIVHRYRDGREQERLQALSGDPREIHRDGDTVTCILPEERAIKAERRAFRGLLPDLGRSPIEEIAAHYELEELGSAQLVGRSCRAVSVRPRDAYRYGYRMWIDEQTALPLKVELLDAEGEPLEQVMFTQISYPASIEDSAFKPARTAAHDFVWIRRQPATDATPAARGWTVARLPPGFRLVMQERQTMPGLHEPVAHMVFTDGLATVSAFIAPPGVPRKLKGLSRRGAVSAYAHRVDDFHVTVVGEVPPATVEMIANELRYMPADATVERQTP
ncbi:MAG TPA: MucB/RseB C-terminal domain-containing protein [Nevskiales bacterium]|nr:MucB/RseB C-terminal domain-containing protein [Nevskiales bacterium]